MVPFASLVFLKVPGKLQGGVLSERWIPGMWLGKRWTSDEHVVSLSGGKVVRGRDIRPFPDDEMYDRSFVNSLIGTPQNPSGAEVDDALHEVPRVPMPRPEGPVARTPTRQVILHKSYFEKCGYSEGCPKCRSMLRGEESSKSAGHVESCRRRIEARMAADPQLKLRLDAAKTRADHFMAEEVEKGDDRKRAPASTSETPRAKAARSSSEDPGQASAIPAAGPADVPVLADEEEENIPEVVEEDRENESENPAKRARTGSLGEGAVGSETEKEVQRSAEPEVTPRTLTSNRNPRGQGRELCNQP